MSVLLAILGLFIIELNSENLSFKPKCNDEYPPCDEFDASNLFDIGINVSLTIEYTNDSNIYVCSSPYSKSLTIDANNRIQNTNQLNINIPSQGTAENYPDYEIGIAFETTEAKPHVYAVTSLCSYSGNNMDLRQGTLGYSKWKIPTELFKASENDSYVWSMKDCGGGDYYLQRTKWHTMVNFDHVPSEPDFFFNIANQTINEITMTFAYGYNLSLGQKPISSTWRVLYRKTTAKPTSNPTRPNPTQSPTEGPTDSTMFPSTAPSTSPTDFPSKTPTKRPSLSPTVLPTNTPSNDPSIYPSEGPSDSPTERPTEVPTTNPSTDPTAQPTNIPTYGFDAFGYKICVFDNETIDGLTLKIKNDDENEMVGIIITGPDHGWFGYGFGKSVINGMCCSE